VHFACTSEDITNLAYGLMLEEAGPLSCLRSIRRDRTLAVSPAARRRAMLARTHGQPPRRRRLARSCERRSSPAARAAPIASCPSRRKFNGASATTRSRAAYPDFDWESFARAFVGSLASNSIHTIQNRAAGQLRRAVRRVARANTSPQFDRDLWLHLAGLLSRNESGRSRSSTMPHKVNPSTSRIRGQISESHNALRDIFRRSFRCRAGARSLGFDVLRNIGVALGHGLLAYVPAERLGQTRGHAAACSKTSTQMGSGSARRQAVMRRLGLPDPYEH